MTSKKLWLAAVLNSVQDGECDAGPGHPLCAGWNGPRKYGWIPSINFGLWRAARGKALDVRRRSVVRGTEQ